MQHLLSNLDADGLLGRHIEPLMKRLGAILGSGTPPKADVARRIRVQTVGARRLQLAHFQAVGGALLRRKRLHISYRARGKDQRSEREVSPQRLIHYRDNWYLDAWCHSRLALRSFSVEAIEQVQVLAQPAIDAAVFEPKAVNPNAVAQVDDRALAQIIKNIQDQGRIVAEALARLNALMQGRVNQEKAA